MGHGVPSPEVLVSKPRAAPWAPHEGRAILRGNSSLDLQLLSTGDSAYLNLVCMIQPGIFIAGRPSDPGTELGHPQDKCCSLCPSQGSPSLPSTPSPASSAIPGAAEEE